MKYFILPLIVLSLMILYSCKDSAVNNPGGPGTIETLIISVDSVYFTDQSANMFSIDTTFLKCSKKKFRLTFTASTNDDDTNNSYLDATFLIDTASSYLWGYGVKGNRININFTQTFSLSYNSPDNLLFKFFMGFSIFHNPPQKWLLLKNFKLYSIN